MIVLLSNGQSRRRAGAIDTPDNVIQSCPLSDWISIYKVQSGKDALEELCITSLLKRTWVKLHQSNGYIARINSVP